MARKKSPCQPAMDTQVNTLQKTMQPCRYNFAILKERGRDVIKQGRDEIKQVWQVWYELNISLVVQTACQAH